MKKTISSTLGGRVYNIEEDAYVVLEGYLAEIKRRYAGEPGLADIIADIESSIAEKFSEKISEYKQAITVEDVNVIIAVMGRPEEISDTEVGGEEAEKEFKTTPEGARRLYRNPDDTVIAGVSSGIAAYVDIDPIIVRIIFIVLAFANGIGILLYLILWIAIPKATTGAQKLAMRGRQVNIEEIKEAVQEKAKMVGDEGMAAFNRMKEKRSVFYHIINFPIRVVAAVFSGIRRIVLAVIPMVSIMVGVGFFAASLLGIIGITIASGIMLFNVNSPYIISDLPLNELTARPLYYVGVIALYAAVAIPLIALSMLGVTLIRRKNSFKTAPSVIMVAVWVLALGAGGVAAADIAPWAAYRIEELDAEQTITRIYDQKDFSKIVVSDTVAVRIKRGDVYGITFTGRQDDLDRLRVSVKDGQLVIEQSSRNRHGLCMFCRDQNVAGEIIVPQVVEYKGIDVSRGSLEGFSNDLVVDLRDVARLDAQLLGQQVTSTVSGVSRFEFSGSAKTLTLTARDGSRMLGTAVQAEDIVTKQDGVSRIELDGTVHSLTVETIESARLSADTLEAQTVFVVSRDVSRVFVWPAQLLQATSTDASRIRYRSDAATISAYRSDMGDIATSTNGYDYE